MPTIGEFVSQLEARLFVGRERELALFEDWLTADSETPAILNVCGPGGIGKSALLRAFRRRAEQLGRSVMFADARNVLGTPDGLLHALGYGDLAELQADLNDRRPLILLDTFEQLTHLSSFLRQQLLACLDSRVKLVVASRDWLTSLWRREDSLHALIHPLPLGGLRPEAARAYLKGRGLQDDRLLEQMLQAAGGVPLALSLAADMVLKFDARNFAALPEWRLVLRALVERLLQQAEDPLLRELLEAAAVVRQFDEEMLEAISGRQDIGSAFRQLCQLSVVRSSERGLRLHQEVAHVLVADLRWRRPERYRELRLRALAHEQGRMRSASADEREWLLVERFHLWEDDFIHRSLFGPDDPGGVMLEPARPGDEAGVIRLERLWQDQVIAKLGTLEWPSNYSREAHFAFMEAILRYPARRLRVAQDREGRALGFNLALPVCRESLKLLERSPIYTSMLHAQYSQAELAALPADPERTNVFLLLSASHVGIEPEAVDAVLLRDLFSVLAHGRVFLMMARLPIHKALLEALGFERIPGVRQPSWLRGYPFEGFVLDLAALGVEPWLEAVTSGRRPPKALKPEELERELHHALTHWRDDACLAEAAAGPLALLVGGGEPDADTLRQAITQALERARAEAGPSDELAYRALQLAYMQKTTSYERAAERLAVSRTTFYRLLKRGNHGLARALSNGNS